jgi:hypothetical protein
MRNPFGSNLDGSWLLASNEGDILYGDTQEQLIEVLLTGDFLKKNHIDISHGAEMSKGWDRVIKKQLELGQKITDKTMNKYQEYLPKVKANEQAHETLSNINSVPQVSTKESLSTSWDKVIKKEPGSDTKEQNTQASAIESEKKSSGKNVSAQQEFKNRLRALKGNKSESQSVEQDKQQNGRRLK